MASWLRPLAALLAFVLAGGSAVPAAAQASNETGIIQITVQEADAKSPLGDARVFLMGPTVASALTTKSGVVKYTDVPSGIYRVRVSKTGFAGATSAAFEVLGNKEIDVQVALGAARAPANTAPPAGTTSDNLKVIGRVEARVVVSTHDVDENSSIRKISDSLTDALGTLAGVDVTQDSNDPNAPQTISLRGMDESQTGVTLDGIPLGAPGAATDLRRINTDLFTGASTSFGPSAGSLAGTVNFRTLQPTQTWQSRLSSSYGTFDRFNYQIGETGSIGRLGIALLHTDRQSNSPLTFQSYLDSSGLTYPHGGESANRGDFLKLRYGLGDKTTLNFTALQNNQANAQLCTQFVTLQPCGIGPGNNAAGRFGFAYGSLQTLIGEASFSLTGYTNSNQSFLADDQRVINGVASPFSSQNQTNARGVAFSSTIAHGKHTFTLSGSTYASRTSFTPIDTAGLSTFVLPSINNTASRAFQLADTFKSNDKLTLGLNLSVAGTTGAGNSFVGGVTAGWRPTNADTFSAGLSLGSSQPASGIVRSFSDPQSAQVNCFANTATVSGPGDQNGPQSALNYQFGWQHRFKTAQVSLNAYRQSQSGQLINALLSGTSAGLPPGYVGQINAYFTQPTVCGSSLGLPTVYVNEFVGNTTRVYQGFDITARIALGRNVVVIPSFTTSSAVVTAADLRLLGADSTTILGSQIPGRPLHKGNLTIDINEPHSGIELLANASYVGPDNAQHIAPYALVNAGLSRQVGIGRLTFFASNVFNTEAGTFSTLQYAEPIPLSGGGYLLTAARPNAPRQFTVTYSFNTGARRGAGFARPRPNAADTTTGAGATGAGGAGGGPPGTPNRLRGQFRFEPAPEGVDPLTFATARESCPADAQQKAQPVMDHLKAVFAAYRSGQPLPQMSEFTATGKGDPRGTAWYVELRPAFGRGSGGAGAGGGGPGGAGQRGPGGGEPGGFGGGPGAFGAPPIQPGNGPVVVAPRSGASPQPRPSPPPEIRERLEAFRAFVGCAYVTALKSSEAKAKGIDVNGPSFGYSPQFGLFFVQPPDLGTGGGSVK